MSSEVRQFYEIVAKAYWALPAVGTEERMDPEIKKKVEWLVCSSVDDLRCSLLSEQDPQVLTAALSMTRRRGWKTMSKMIEAKLKRMEKNK